MIVAKALGLPTGAVSNTHQWQPSSLTWQMAELNMSAYSSSVQASRATSRSEGGGDLSSGGYGGDRAEVLKP